MMFQCEEKKGEDIAWIHSPVLFMQHTILSHSPPHDIIEGISTSRVFSSWEAVWAKRVVQARYM